MSKKINVEEIQVEIAKVLEEYTEDVEREIKKEIDRTARAVRDEIESKAPRKTGVYAKGFKIKKDDIRSKTVRIIYNATKPSLTHLLEKGHLKRGGKGRVRAIPHIIPAYLKHVDKMEKNIEEIIKNGG